MAQKQLERIVMVYKIFIQPLLGKLLISFLHPRQKTFASCIHVEKRKSALWNFGVIKLKHFFNVPTNHPKLLQTV